MYYKLIKSPMATQTDCLVLGIHTDDDVTKLTEFFQPSFVNLLIRLRSKLYECGDWVWQTDVDGHNVMLIHCGKQAEFDRNKLRKYLTEMTEILLKQHVNSATICLPTITEYDPDWQIVQMLLHIEAVCYQLLDYKTIDKKPHALQTVQFFLPNAKEGSIKTALAIAQGIKLTKTLVNLPANHCTPTFLGEQAQKLAKEQNSITTKIITRDEMNTLGMGALLAVAQGSAEPPCLIEMTYKGSDDTKKPIVLVGKGITFDSGGLSLKPANVMDEMKYDMAGAASIFGTIEACALLELPINVIGLIASAENMPSGTAVKPGDIITTMSGQTVEILNTDAEGRLVLADALTYAKRFNPDFIIDIATLTGAIIVALGAVNTGFMTPDDNLAKQILAAAKESDDKCWRLPLEDDYQEALDSPLADMINAGFDRTASSITAACFLSRFTKEMRWAHLDIAGTAWITGKNRQATGRPVPLLIQILRHHATTSSC